MKLTAELQKKIGTLIKTDPHFMEFIRHRVFTDIWFWDLTDPVSEWMHPRYARLLGYSQEELSKPAAGIWEQIINQEDLQNATSHLHEYLKIQGPVLDIVIRYRHKSNATVWLKFFFKSIRFRKGQVRTLLGAFEDISLHKNWQTLQQVMDHARESEEKYRTIFEKNQLVSLAIDPENGAIMDANEAAAAFYGYSHQQLLGMNISQINTLTTEEVRNEMQAAMTEKRNHFYFKHRLASGEIRYVEVYSTPIILKNKQYLHSQIHDITEKIRAEQIASRNNQVNLARLQLLEFSLNHPIEAILEEALNLAEKITDSRIGFYHFVNDDQKSLTLQNWSTNTKKLFCKLQLHDKHYDINLAGVWVDCIYQRKPVIHNNYDALPHKKGIPQGHATIIRELTVPVILAQKVVAIMGVGNKDEPYHAMDVESLEQLASFSFQIIQHKRLEEKHLKNEKRLQELNQTKDRLMSIIGHDVKGPVGSILGISDMMLDKLNAQECERQKRFLTAINTAARNTMNLLENLLSWARSQNANSKPAVEKIHLQSFTETILQTHSPAATLKNIHFNLQIPESLHITTDPMFLATVLRNLLSNAIKFSYTNGSIDIFTHVTTTTINLTVKDYGLGMSREIRNSLFDIEKTISQPGTSDEKGSGIGLVLCKEYAEKQGGDLQVSSQAKKGTAFTLSLPL